MPWPSRDFRPASTPVLYNSPMSVSTTPIFIPTQSTDCKPFVIAALTADGFIGRRKDQSSFDWTSREDKRWHSQQTKRAGCVIFGRTTFETFNRPLPKRLNLIYSRSKPEEFAQKSAAEIRQAAAAGETQLYYTQLPLPDLVAKLGEIGYEQLSVSGGASVYHQFLSGGLVEKVFLTYEPVLFGQGQKFLSGEIDLKLKLVTTHQLSEQTMVLEFAVS